MGISIDEAAERTKIRARYLKALEAENWAALPSPAYAKGFLRTYARMLGLSADELVDDLRRALGGEPEHPSLVPFGDPVLSERRRPLGLEEPRGRHGVLLAGLGVGALAVALVLIIAGGLGDDSSHQDRHASGSTPQRHHEPAGAPSGPVTLRLRALHGAQVCLIGDGRALIDSQALSPGAKAGPFHSRRFRLDLQSFGGGVLRLGIDGRRRKLRAHGRSSYLIHPGGVNRTRYRGPQCP
jgi:hypothetical protein